MKKAVVAVLWNSRTTPQTSICGARPTPRASRRPSSGALIACVNGTPNRAGPMIATLSSGGGGSPPVSLSLGGGVASPLPSVLGVGGGEPGGPGQVAASGQLS